VERRDTVGETGNGGGWVFVAHGYQNQVHVVDAITGQVNNTFSTPNPGAMAVWMESQLYEKSAVWVIEDANSTNASYAGPARVVRKYVVLTTLQHSWLES
jgi:hypothetical protein